MDSLHQAYCVVEEARPGARSHCRSAPPLARSTPDSLTCSVRRLLGRENAAATLGGPPRHGRVRPGPPAGSRADRDALRLARGAGARPRGRAVPPLAHLIPVSRRESAPRFLRRRCDRTPGGPSAPTAARWRSARSRGSRRGRAVPPIRSTSARRGSAARDGPHASSESTALDSRQSSSVRRAQDRALSACALSVLCQCSTVLRQLQ